MGTKTINISPDFNEAAKFADLWIKPKQGTDAALGMAMGHVILKEFYQERRVPYFENYVKQYSDLPFLVKIEKKNDRYVAGKVLRASDLEEKYGNVDNAEWEPLLIDEKSNELVIPNGTIGSRWDKSKKWSLEMKNLLTGEDILPELSLVKNHDEVVEVAYPYFGGNEYKHEYFNNTKHSEIINHQIPVRRSPDGSFLYTTVYDLTVANYGLSLGLPGQSPSPNYSDDTPYTPAWQEKITGVPASHVISTARQFADNAMRTEGKSMIIIGCGVNQWFHTDMIYRSAINMLIFCGCIGKSGGGWSHYVGQEKLRPQTGWSPLAFALDWHRPPRHMNATSYFYMHTNQWRYEKVGLSELISPLADKQKWEQLSMIDCNVKAERMGWLPSSPQLSDNPIKLSKAADNKKVDINNFITDKLKNNQLSIASEDPDNPKNFPRNMFIWRSNLLASSAKGMEYFMEYLLGAQHGVLGDDLKTNGMQLPQEVKWHDQAPEGKLDLLVTLDFRMSTSALDSDIVLPAATWYEKNDLSTTDLHPFIHPFSDAVDPVWEARTDWNIFKGLAKKISELSHGHLGEEKDIVLQPMQHDSPLELSDTANAKDWKTDNLELKPGKNMPSIIEVVRNYPEMHKRFTSLGPLMEELGNGGKGLNWDTKEEVALLKKINNSTNGGVETKRVPIETDIHAAEMILTLAPETNGKVAVKAWKALENITGRTHQHLASVREDEQIRFKDLIQQPRKIITSPIWSGVESHDVSYNAGYTNVHELIPWRTLTGRQSIYQDHPWMIDFGENLVFYKPPIDTKSLQRIVGKLEGIMTRE